MNAMDNTERKRRTELAIQEYLDTPELSRSLTKVCEKYGLRRQTLSIYLKERGCEIINQQNRTRINETLFDEIDTEEKAYWLGFLYADGNISYTGNRIEVHLAIKDLSHLEKFRQFLHHETEIRTGINKEGYGFCHLAIRNKHMWEALDKLGCSPRKSLTLEFPKLEIFKRKDLIKHFLRGYVDGDGCLSVYEKNPKNHVTTLSIVGTEQFLQVVNKLCWNKGYIRNKSCKNWENKAFQLSFPPVASRSIARLLYENATIYLERKYNKFLEFCRLEEESSKRKSSKIGEDCDVDTEVLHEITKGSCKPLSVENE